MTFLIGLSIICLLIALVGLVLSCHNKIPDSYSFWYEYSSNSQPQTFDRSESFSGLHQGETQVWPRT